MPKNNPLKIKSYESFRGRKTAKTTMKINKYNKR